MPAMELQPRVAVGVNLLYLRPGRVGGSETYVRELVHELSKLPDLSLHLLLGRESVDAFGDSPGVTRVVVSRTRYSAAGRLYSENWRLRAVVREHGLRVLFSPANFGAPLLLSGVPQVVTVHDFQHDEYPAYFSRRTRVARNLLFRASFARAAHIVAISEFTRRSALERYGVAPEQITTIHQGAPSRAAPDAAYSADLARSYGLDGPFFIYPAMVAPHKNHALLLRAFRDHVDRGAVEHLVLTGKDTDDSQAIGDAVAELGLEERVHRLGFIPRDHIVALLSRARALVFPSRFEGFGLPPLEAMSLGVPVIAARAASVPEVVGEAALLVDPDDATGWADAMQQLAGDPERRQQLIARGRDHVRTFTWERCARSTRDVLRRAATGARMTPCS